MSLSDRKSENKSAPVQEEAWFNLKDYFSEAEVLRVIPKNVASKYNLFPLYVKGEVLHVAMANPKDLKAIDEVRRVAKLRAIVPHASKRDDILSAIDRNYAMQDNVTDIVSEIQQEKMEAGPAAVALPARFLRHACCRCAKREATCCGVLSSSRFAAVRFRWRVTC